MSASPRIAFAQTSGIIPYSSLDVTEGGLTRIYYPAADTAHAPWNLIPALTLSVPIGALRRRIWCATFRLTAGADNSLYSAAGVVTGAVNFWRGGVNVGSLPFNTYAIRLGDESPYPGSDSETAAVQGTPFRNLDPTYWTDGQGQTAPTPDSLAVTAQYGGTSKALIYLAPLNVMADADTITFDIATLTKVWQSSYSAMSAAFFLACQSDL